MGLRDIINRARSKLQDVRLQTTVPAGESIREQSSALTAGKVTTQPIKDVVNPTGFTSTRDTKPTFTSGGGGGSTPSTVPEEITQTREFSEQTEEKRAKAREEGVSPQIQATRERQAIAEAVREEANRRAVDISTPLRERRFINRLRKEDKPKLEKKIFRDPFAERELTFKSAKTGTEFVTAREPGLRRDVTKQPTRTDIGLSPFDAKVEIPGQKEQFSIPKNFLTGVPDAPRKETIIKKTPEIPESAFGFKFDISKEPGLTEKLRQQAFVSESKGEGIGIGTVAGVTAGALVSLKGTGQFVKAVATEPVETFGRTLEAVTIKAPENIVKVGQVIESEPAFATGFIAGEVAQFKAINLAQKGALKVSDAIRTRGLKELPSQQLIAPEFTRGQTFPQIRRGQTAGQLKAEFKPILPGEIKPAGFTASPKPLGELIVRRGSSELPGLFQSPKISPKFLRVTGAEKKVVTVHLLGESARPSVFRVTPTDFKLAPGIKSSTKIIQPGKQASISKFIETKAPRGQSIIPFIKTEKEAVIPIATQLTKPTKRFFFRFEGRRIPIFETQTIGGKAPKGIPTITSTDISKIISSSRVGRRGIITPPQLISLASSRTSRASIQPSSISITPSSSKIRGSTSRLSSIGKSIASRPSISRARPSRSISSIASRGSISSIARGSKSRISIAGAVSSRARGTRAGRITTPSFFGGRTPRGQAPRIRTTGTFGVSVRRRGKFRTIGSNLSLPKAITLGRGVVSRGLGATFRLTPQRKGTITGNIRTPRGFRRGRGLTFIEQPRFRLSKITEVKEIQTAKRRKKRK